MAPYRLCRRPWYHPQQGHSLGYAANSRAFKGPPRATQAQSRVKNQREWYHCGEAV